MHCFFDSFHPFSAGYRVLRLPQKYRIKTHTAEPTAKIFLPEKPAKHFPILLFARSILRKTRTTHVFWLELHEASSAPINPPTFPLAQWRMADKTILTAARPRPISTDFRLWPGLNFISGYSTRYKNPLKEHTYFYSLYILRQRFFSVLSSDENLMYESFFSFLRHAQFIIILRKKEAIRYALTTMLKHYIMLYKIRALYLNKCGMHVFSYA